MTAEPRTQSERRASSESKVLDAAIQMIGQYGVAGASLERISRAAGCSVGLTAYLFETKPGIVRAAARRIQDRWIRYHVNPTVGASRGREAVLRSIEAYFREGDTRPVRPVMRAFFELYAVGTTTDPSLSRALVSDDRLTVLLTQHVEDGREDGSIDAGLDASSTATFLTLLLRGVAMTWLSDREPVPLSELRDHLLEHVDGFLRSTATLAPVAHPERRSRSSRLGARTVEERLLDAALEIVARGTLNTMTMGDVGASAGYSKGQATNVFRTKLVLVDRLCKHVEEALSARIAAGTDASSDSSQVMRVVSNLASLISAESRASRAAGVLFNELIHEKSVFDSVVRPREVALRARIASVIAQERDGALLRPTVNPDREAALMVGLFRGLVLLLATDPTAYDVDALGAHSWRLLQNLRRAPEPAQPRR